MIKQIIYGAIYAAITVLLTLTILETGHFITTILVLNIAFVALILFTVFRNLAHSKAVVSGSKTSTGNTHDKAGQRPEFDIAAVNKISRRPALLGIEKKLVSEEEFYFDDDFFYAVDPDGAVSKYLHDDIAELAGTGTQIGNSRIWKVLFERESKVIEYKFTHNYSLWNKSFYQFYRRVKEIRPHAVRTEWSLWRM